MKRPTDQDLDVSVAGMLRFGVTLAAIVVLVGGIQSIRHRPPALPDYADFHAVNASMRTMSGILNGVRHLDPKCIIQFGLVLLIATPVARVVYCVVGFARQRNWLYVAFSFTVLLILTYSLSKGASHLW